MKRATVAARRAISEVWLLGVILVIGWLVTTGAKSLYFPPPGEVVTDIVDGFVSGPLLGYLGSSMGNLMIGLGVAGAVGVALGTVIGMSETVRQVVDPALQLLRATPKVALVPLLVALFGLGATPKIAIVALAAVWPILINTMDGVRELDPVLSSVARSYRVPLALRIRRIILPAALPQIMSGIAIALSLGVTVLVVSEMYAATQGLGFYVLQSGRSFDVVGVWAGTVVLGVVGYLLNLGMRGVERRTERWSQHSAKQTRQKGTR